MRNFYFLALLLFSAFGFGQIVANDDNYPFAGIGSIGNNNVGNILTNDTLNGNSALSSQIVITVVNPANPIWPGSTVPSINTTTGEITIVPNTPAGTYTITYSICEMANPNNCDTAVVTIGVSAAAIDAVNDGPFTFTSSGSSSSVLANDTINGMPIIPSLITITMVSSTNPGITLSGTNVVVAAGTPNGNYTLTYQICEILNPTNCDVATVSIVANINPLNIGMVGVYNDYNNDGFVNVGDVINYQITLTNNGSTSITNLTDYLSSMTVSGGTLTSLNAGTSNSTFFTGVHVITQAEINAGNVFGFICFSGDLGVQSCLDGINTPLSQSNGIKLQAFIDSNSNGIKDGSESFFSGGHFNYSINGGPTSNLYTSFGINYLYESNPTTTYNFSYTTPNSGYICTTSFTNITVPNGSGITTYNFPIIVNPIVDLAVYLLNNTPPRPGFTYCNTIYLKNNGNQTIPSGTLTFTKNNVVSFVSLPSGSLTTSNGFTLNYSNLLPNESKIYSVCFSVPTIPTVALGQQLTNSVTTTIPAGDVNVNNNTSSITQTIVGSYDPNDKQENHGGKIVHSTFTSNDYLTYTIRFENTGTAEAINVRVEDVLDNQLDENSIIMVASSHNYVLRRVGNNLTWRFDGINLPPSVPNTQIGHGYITFQIKPKPGYAIGDIIPNTASIYFDFNPPIITNTHLTEFVTTLANDNFAFNELNYYPNPVKNSLTISNASIIDSVEITSVLGQKIIAQKVNNLQTDIDFSGISNGIYFVNIISEGQEKTVKIVKE